MDVAPQTLEDLAGIPAGRYRVVRIQSRMCVAGATLNVMNLALGLEDDYPTLVMTGALVPGESDVTDVARARGIHVVRIPDLGRSVRPGQDLAAIVKLTSILKRLRPEIVHTHTAKAGAAGRIAALAAGVPIRIHTFHGHVFEGYFSKAMSRMVVLTERALARISTRIVAISKSQAHDLIERFSVVPARKVAVIPLGLELDRFASPPPGAREAFRQELDARDRPVISIIGRVVPIKNHRMFLDAAALVLQQGIDAVFAVVGGGSEEEGLRAYAAERGIADSVRFLGYRDDLDRIYAGTDVLALTSDNEGTPVTIIEALSAGVPVVATAVGGVADVLENGRLGALVPPRDAAAFARAIANLLQSGAPRVAAEDSNAIRSRYGAPRLVHDMRALYDELVAQLPSGGVR